jgi:hypothetical protein
MPPVEFEPTITASERPQTYALDLATTEIDVNLKITATKRDEFKPYIDCNSCSKHPSMYFANRVEFC